MSAINRTLSSVMSNENTPLILTIVSCTGVVITAIMTARAAPKSQAMLFELEGESPKPATFKQKVRRVWKVWVPPVLSGGVTLASIITMNRVSARNADLLSASAMLATNTLREYQQHVLEEIGPEKDSKIRDKMAKSTLAKTAMSDESANLFLIDGEGGVALDTISGRYFRYSGSSEDIRSVENTLNREILQVGYVSLNELYHELGLDPIEIGEFIGFNSDNMIDIHFAARLDSKNRPVLVLDFMNVPVTGFNK